MDDNTKENKKQKSSKKVSIGKTDIIDYNSTEIYKINNPRYNEKHVKFFTDLKVSTIVIQGALSNIEINEKEFIDLLCIDKDSPILCISCNYGIVYRNGYVPVKKIKSNRGRKKTSKRENVRKRNGTGTEFDSQLTFNVFSNMTNKYYKIKIFRNGTFGIPGVLYEDWSDIYEPLQAVCDYFMNYCGNDKVGIMYDKIKSTTCNFSTFIKPITLPNNTIINNEELEENVYDVFKKDKHNELEYIEYCGTKYIRQHVDQSALQTILEVYILNNLLRHIELPLIDLGTLTNSDLDISINYNKEKFSGLIFKVSTPTEEKPNKKTTIKIFDSGKIGIDGATNAHFVKKIYRWINKLFTSYNYVILYNVGHENVYENRNKSDVITKWIPVVMLDFVQKITDWLKIIIDSEDTRVNDPILVRKLNFTLDIIIKYLPYEDNNYTNKTIGNLYWIYRGIFDDNIDKLKIIN